MLRLLGVWVLCLPLLFGCVQPERKGVSLPESEWSDARVADLLYPTVEEPEPEAAMAPPPLPKRKPEQVVELPTEAGEANSLDIERLVGLDFDATQALLGEPALDEVQPPARVWAYNGRGCVLSIFFFPNVDGQSYRALTYEVKGAEGSPERTRACFAELVQEKRGT